MYKYVKLFTFHFTVYKAWYFIRYGILSCLVFYPLTDIRLKVSYVKFFATKHPPRDVLRIYTDAHLRVVDALNNFIGTLKNMYR